MPTPITTCGSCRQTLYREAGVKGACTCKDGPYWTLLAQQKARNAAPARTRTASVTAPATAPTATPQPTSAELTEMLLSPAGRQEVRAMEALRSGAVRPTGGVSRGRPNASGDEAGFDFSDLGSAGGLDVQFDLGDDIDIPEGPRPRTAERARFRVDQPRVMERFEPRTMPDAYTVVGNRVETRERATQGQVVRNLREPPRPAPPPPTRVPVPTAYDHLDRGVIDDDPFS